LTWGGKGGEISEEREKLGHGRTGHETALQRTASDGPREETGGKKGLTIRENNLCKSEIGQKKEAVPLPLPKEWPGKEGKKLGASSPCEKAKAQTDTSPGKSRGSLLLRIARKGEGCLKSEKSRQNPGKKKGRPRSAGGD